MRILFISTIAVVLITTFSISFIGLNSRYYTGKIFPRVFIDTVNVGGKTPIEAIRLLQKRFPEQTDFTITVIFEDAPIATMSAVEINFHYPFKEVVEQSYLVGRSPRLISRLYQQIALLTGLEQYSFPLVPTYQKDTVVSQLKLLNDSYRVEAQNARFEFNNSKVSAFQLDKKGFELDVQQALAEFEQQILSQKKNFKNERYVTASKIILYPDIKMTEINTYGIRELVGTGHSRFVGSHVERIHNIRTGSEKLNGIIIKPGETFSFVEALGDISRATGYKQAYIIKEGKTVLGDGGGICQVSSTLFRAALNVGLPIIERNAHAYRVAYYEQNSDPGFDATIYSPTVDLKIKNDYSTALLIQARFDEENLSLSFELYGARDNRNIEISKATVWNIAPPPEPEYIDDPTLRSGLVNQVDFAAWGASTKFHYKVVKDEKITFEQDFVSHFRPWKAIFMVGRG